MENLANELDESLDAFIEEMQAKNKDFKYQDGWTEENWEEEMEKHPAFRTRPFEPGEELPPEFEALQQLKYGEDVDPQEKAENYKIDGNQNFKFKKYQWAVESYTEGIKVRCADKMTNAVLYTNRAAAHFHLGNIRSSLRDATFARKFKGDHMKAILRGAECCLKLGLYDACQKSWCDVGLLVEPGNAKLLQVRSAADTGRRVAARDSRRRDKKDGAARRDEDTLLAAIKCAGVRLTRAAGDSVTSDRAEMMANILAAADHTRGHMVLLTEGGGSTPHLVWPVFFLYPEVGTSDLVVKFSELDTLGDHVTEILGEPPAWDDKGRYAAHAVQVYYENRPARQFYRVDLSWTLAQLLSQDGFWVVDGCPTVYVLPTDCPQTLKDKYNVVT